MYKNPKSLLTSLFSFPTEQQIRRISQKAVAIP